MKIKLRLSVEKSTTWHIDLVAENDGEKAILHLLQESKELVIERNTDYHPSYRLTSAITLFPKKNGEG